MSAAVDSRGNVVCVLGFGRSGTSLTIRLLSLLGVDIGPEEDLLAPDEGDNPRGYWEPRWMIELNDEILARLDAVWWRPPPAAPGWQRSADFDELRDRARGLLAEKFGSAPLWGWKDPRTTVTLPFWKELVPHAKYVICMRNPADAVSSIQRRPDPNLPVERWGDLWLEYTARALEETQGYPRALVFYEDYFQDPDRPLAAMGSLLDIEPARRRQACRSLRGEIELTLRHHATSPRELAATAGISSAARMLFLALRAAHDASGAGDDGALLSDAIGRVAYELWWDRRTLIDLHDAFPEAKQTIALLREEQSKLTGDIMETRAQAEELDATVRGLSGETAGLRGELAHSHAEHDNTRSQLESTRNQLESTRLEAVASAARLEQAHTTRQQLEDRLARQSAIVEQMCSSLSWRLTVPLRAAKRVFARPHRAGGQAPDQTAPPTRAGRSRSAADVE